MRKAFYAMNFCPEVTAAFSLFANTPLGQPLTMGLDSQDKSLGLGG